jgi:hypothetical protein
MITYALDLQKPPRILGMLVRGGLVVILTALSALISHSLAQGGGATPLLAQSSPKSPSSSPSSKNSAALKTSSKPAWQDLTPAQQLSLKPLAASWNSLGDAHKRKWIAIAANYPNLGATEQEKLHSRMTEWVSLNQQQRTQARLNYARSKQLTPSQKAATWQAYQALSPEEKQKLAISAAPKPVGAATAVKPVARQKLAVVPVTRRTPKPVPRISTATNAVNRNTLLPHSPPPTERATTQKN